MVLKSSLGTSVEEEEEEDVYLRKCNIRKSKRQNEKSRKIAIQVNEQLSLDRIPSPVPLPNIRASSVVGKSPARKEKAMNLQSPHLTNKSRTNSTDDVYPAPSPPPRSPSFGSPVALSRTLALSLSLFSPGGFTISGAAASGRKNQIRHSPDTIPASHTDIQRAHSTDSNGSWGEIVDIGSPHSPQRSPSLDQRKQLDPSSNSSSGVGSGIKLTPLRNNVDDDYYKDGESNAHLRDSNRVKQFLFHRDRNRARKAQLLYPSGTYGNSCEFSPDLDDVTQSPAARNRADRKISSPASLPHSGNHPHRSARRTGSFSQQKQHQRRMSDENNLKVDYDIDVRSGSIGSVGSTPHAYRKASFRMDSPSTPFAVPPINTEYHNLDEGSPFAQNSPYYRALTLGARNSPTVHALSGVNKDARTNSVSSVGSNSSEQSAAPGSSPTMATNTIHNITASSPTPSDSYIRRRRDSITSQDSANSADKSVEIYDSLFPALPGGPLVKTYSNLSAGIAEVLHIKEIVAPVAPVIYEHTVEQLAVLFYASIVRAGLAANNMPTTPNTAVEAIAGTSTAGSASIDANSVRSIRAWDDADSSDDESNSDCSFDSSVDSHTNSSISMIQSQVQKLLQVDATCGNLIQKCDYIYDTMKARIPYKFSSEYTKNMVQPFLVLRHYTECPVGVELTINELFGKYVQTRLVYQLVQMLQYEDTRFESLRVPVLYVLYKGGADTAIEEDHNKKTPGKSKSKKDSPRHMSVRVKIAQAIEHTTSERHQRCRQLLHTATATEMDVNFISKAGFSELVTIGSSNNICNSNPCIQPSNPVCAVATACDISAVIESENERSAYKTKDSEVTIIELIKFIIAHEVTELLMQSQAQDNVWSVESKVTSPNSRSSSASKHKKSAKDVKNDAISVRNAESRSVLLCLVRAYCSLFRCYTYKLGAHYAGSGDSVEQPILLEYLMQTLDGLLAWAKVLTNNNVDAMYSSGISNGSASGSSKSVLEEVCECILQSTYKHWTNGLNFAQDVAYLLQSEVVLTIYNPTGASNTSSSEGEGMSYSAMFASLNRTNSAAKAVLPPLFHKHVKHHAKKSATHSPASTPATTPTTTPTTVTATPATSTTTIYTSAIATPCLVQRVLIKMLHKVCSQHVKVATQAMQSLQSPILMVRYFLPRMTTAMVSYIFGTEVGRSTFMTGPGWDNNLREECLNLLVDKLRDCRNVYLNFSTQLQISSTQLLDTTLELLQVIEDAE